MEVEKLNIGLFETMSAVDDKIVVEKYELKGGEQKTSSGIIMPGINRRITMTGLVVDVGPKYTGSVKKGYYVIYNEFTGAPVEFDDKILIGLEPQQIFGILIPKEG